MTTVLVLADIRNEAQKRVAILDHVRFLDHAPRDRVQVTYVNMAEQPPFDPRWLEYDVVVLHTTLLCWRWHPQFGTLIAQIEWLTRYTGIVAAIPQDEYDHAHVLDDLLYSLRTKIIITCFDSTHRALMYPRMHKHAYFFEGLTGYLHPARVASITRRGIPHARRRVDVVYRANNLPHWFGWLGHMKARLGTDTAARLSAAGLHVDISVRPEDTVLGDGWLDFLGGSRAILGSESGSSVLDRRGEISAHVRALLVDRPGLTFEEADACCEGELSRYHFAAIGPRHLEAMMTRTVQVLVEGSYSGLFTSGVHYIPLQRDLSNLESVAEALADTVSVARMADRAYADFVASGRYGYDKLAVQFLEIVAAFQSLRSQGHAATT